MGKNPAVKAMGKIKDEYKKTKRLFKGKFDYSYKVIEYLPKPTAFVPFIDLDDFKFVASIELMESLILQEAKRRQQTQDRERSEKNTEENAKTRKDKKRREDKQSTMDELEDIFD